MTLLEQTREACRFLLEAEPASPLRAERLEALSAWSETVLGVRDEAQADNAADLLWKARLALHQRLPEIPEDLIPQVRIAFRDMRSVEDALLESTYAGPILRPEKLDFFREAARPVLDSAPSYRVLTAPGVDSRAIRFRAGDILIARGPSFLSASIARLSDPPSQFSHIVLVHVGEHGAVSTLESYHHVGLQSYELDTALRNENVRLMLLRPKDAKLGEASARALCEVVRRAPTPIPYDFELDFVDHSAVSCAEVASYAYELGSGGTVTLPRYESAVGLDAKTRRVFGLSGDRTFEPADMEVDPRFDLLVEWRDLRLLPDSRYKDAILTVLFRWIAQGRFAFPRSLGSFVAGNVVWPCRKTPLWPILRLLGAPRISRTVPRSLLVGLRQIQEAGEPLRSRLEAADEEHRRSLGTRMSPVQLDRLLEEWGPGMVPRGTSSEDSSHGKDNRGRNRFRSHREAR